MISTCRVGSGDGVFDSGGEDSIVGVVKAVGEEAGTGILELQLPRTKDMEMRRIMRKWEVDRSIL